MQSCRSSDAWVRLLNNLRDGPKGYEVVEFACSANVMHVHVTRTALELKLVEICVMRLLDMRTQIRSMLLTAAGNPLN